MTAFLSDILAIVEAKAWDELPNKSKLHLATFGGVYDARPITQSVATQDSNPQDIFFKPDGTKMYEVGPSSGFIYESDLSTPWDISTAVFNQSIAAQDTTPTGIFFSPDGTKMYEVGTGSDLVYESDLSVPWDISTRVFNQSISTQDTGPRSIQFSPDGLKMYELGASSGLIYESNLSVAWDISTAVFSQSTAAQDTGTAGIFFKPDGTKMYEVGAGSQLIYESYLSTPWDISTAVFNQSIASQGTIPTGIFLKPDGLKVYEIDTTSDLIYESDLSVPWDIDTANSLKSIATQDTISQGIFFKPDGTKMYEIGAGDQLVYESDLSTPWDIFTAVFNQSVATQGTGPTGIFFKPDGTKMYEIGAGSQFIYESDISVPWDISTRVFNQSIATQDTVPTGIFFSPDGTKMYEIGNVSDLVYESDLGTAWDISTAVFSQSIATQDTRPQGIFFKPDGTKMYEIGAGSQFIYESDLSVAWDISTAVFINRISSLRNPTDLFFSGDGKKLYQSSTSLISEVNLNRSWDIQYKKTHYAGRLTANVIFESQINVVFWGQQTVNPDFGYMDIGVADQNADIIDFAQKVTVADISFYRVRPNGTIRQLALSRSSEIGFADENTIRLRLESRLANVFNLPINEFFYDATNPDLDGKPYPIMWGPGPTGDIEEARQMIPTLQISTGSLPEYHVSDLDLIDLADVDQAPMDRGLALGPSQFTLVDNGFTLDANAEGKVTFFQPTDGGVEDPNDAARLEGMFRFIRLAAQRVDVYDYLFIPDLLMLDSLLPKDDFPQFQTLDVVRLRDFMSQIFDSFAGYFYVDFNGIINYGQLTPPDDATPVYEFTDSNTTGPIQVNDDTAPNLSDRITYGENWGALSEADLAVDLEDSEFKRARITKHYEKKTGENIIEFYQPARSAKALKWSGRYALSEVQSVATQNGACQSIFFKPDGLKMYEIDSTSDRIYESDLSVPWDISTASFVQSIATQDITPTGIFFKPDGLKMYELGANTGLIYESDLGTAWDISTRVFNQSIATEDSTPIGLFFKPDGTKAYYTDFTTNLIYESDLSTPWDINTVLFVQSIASQDAVSVGLFLSPDGTKMYEVGQSGDLIYESDLSTPWDISTRVFNQSIATQSDFPRGPFFKPDGTGFYQTSVNLDLIYQTTLSTPWDIASGPAVGAFPLDELNRWWMQLYPVRRRFYTFQAELVEENSVLALGQVISLQSDRAALLTTAKNLTIRRLRFDMDNGILTVEAWG